MPIQTFFDQRLIFVHLCQHAKNQFIPFAHSSNKVNFRASSPDWPHPFLTKNFLSPFKLREFVSAITKS